MIDSNEINNSNDELSLSDTLSSVVIEVMFQPPCTKCGENGIKYEVSNATMNKNVLNGMTNKLLQKGFVKNIKKNIRRGVF